MLTPQDKALFAEAVQAKDSGNLHEALRLFSDILQRNNEDAGLHYVVGLVHWNLGQLEQAIVHFQAATEIDPNNESMSLGLFHCLWELGQKVEALEEAKRFVAVAHSDTYRQIVDEITSKLESK